MRLVKAAVSAAALGTVLIGGAAALAAGRPAGGSVHVFATPGPKGTIVLTGAIGDYGKTVNIDKSGKVDPNGVYVKVNLTKGTFEINAAVLNAKLAKLQPTIDQATCSAQASGSDSVSLLDGGGLYNGISGTLNVTATFAFIAPRFTSGKKKGQCNLSNSAQPLDQYSSITGAGTVKFG
jgi:hypothetical protein